MCLDRRGLRRGGIPPRMGTWRRTGIAVDVYDSASVHRHRLEPVVGDSVCASDPLRLFGLVLHPSYERPNNYSRRTSSPGSRDSVAQEDRNRTAFGIGSGMTRYLVDDLNPTGSAQVVEGS